MIKITIRKGTMIKRTIFLIFHSIFLSPIKPICPALCSPFSFPVLLLGMKLFISPLMALSALTGLDWSQC